MVKKSIQEAIKILENSILHADHRVFRRCEQTFDAIVDVPYVAQFFYKKMTRWPQREACVANAKVYATVLPSSIELAKLAVNDRAAEVRYTAYCVLGFSLKDYVIPFLESIDENTLSYDDRDYRSSSMRAIRHKNHNFFNDKKITGRSKITYFKIDEEGLIERFGADWKSVMRAQKEEIDMHLSKTLL